MNDGMRWSGIDILGEVPWGTHLCLFFPGETELIELATNYIAAGLADNEACVWSVCAPLTCARARQALEAKIPQCAEYLAAGRLEILDAQACYRPNGVFDADIVLKGWLDRERQAVQRGYAGLRVCGDVSWLEAGDWAAFQDYEKQVDASLDQYRMLALCAYPQERCGASL